MFCVKFRQGRCSFCCCNRDRSASSTNSCLLARSTPPQKDLNASFWSEWSICGDWTSSGFIFHLWTRSPFPRKQSDKRTAFQVRRLYTSIMQNESGENVDLYVPRKCSWTNRLVKAKEHSSVQINVANVDPVTGVATGDSTPYCIGGYIRFKSEGDVALTTLVQKNDIAMLAGSEE